MRRDRGASAIEYAILVAATAALLLAVGGSFTRVMSGLFEGSCNSKVLLDPEWQADHPAAAPVYTTSC